MEQRSIFFDEWIKSLREQYKYVIRNNDQVTLPSLTEVMHDVGFTDDELAHLRVEATMHIDDVSDDFVPDLKVLDNPQAGQPHPDECTCAQCIPIDESKFDDEGQPLTDIDPEQASYETGHVFAVAKPDILPAQTPDELDTISDLSEDIELLDTVDDLTFEDSLEDDIDVLYEEGIEEPDDEAEDDPDAPQQMSMF